MRKWQAIFGVQYLTFLSTTHYADLQDTSGLSVSAYREVYITFQTSVSKIVDNL